MVVMVTVGVAFTTSVRFRLAEPPSDVVTLTATVEVEVPEGVPLMVPAVLMVRPVGRPVADHVYVAVLPVAASVVEYATPVCPAGSVLVVMVMVGFTTRVRFRFAEPPSDVVTLTATVEVDAPEGVPLMVPEVLMVRPVGRPVADHV